MTVSFVLLAVSAIVGTAAAMSLRNLVHCVLALAVGLVGLAGLYLQLGAQFVGFTQVIVYLGAVAILTVFAIMMTRSPEQASHHIASKSWLAGALVAVLVFATFTWAIHSAAPMLGATPPQAEVSVRQIGIALMQRFVLPFEIIGVLLTAALIGAGVLAMSDKERAR
jgi:NADH-quinone oxidoreductase subunit J